jgi:hypothetical protein
MQGQSPTLAQSCYTNPQSGHLCIGSSPAARVRTLRVWRAAAARAHIPGGEQQQRQGHTCQVESSSAAQVLLHSACVTLAACSCVALTCYSLGPPAHSVRASVQVAAACKGTHTEWSCEPLVRLPQLLLSVSTAISAPPLAVQIVSLHRCPLVQSLASSAEGSVAAADMNSSGSALLSPSSCKLLFPPCPS